MADIEPQAISWLWLGRIALGKVTLFSGDPGLGKSFVTLDIATRVSNGTEWADSSGMAPKGSVLLLNSEDGAADTMRPRLDRMGANVNSIHILRAIRRGEKERLFSLVDDIEQLEQAANQIDNCKLIVIDPITSYLAGIDGNKSSDVRSALDPLKELAERTGAAVLLINHLNKGSGAAMYRSSGSISIMGMARCAWTFAKDREDPGRRLMVPVKNNISKENSGMAFSLVDGAVIWEPEPIDISADEALAFEPKRQPRTNGALEQAKQFLKEMLANGEKIKQSEIEEAAKQADISDSTLRRAKSALNVKSEKNGFDGNWQWWLIREFPTWDDLGEGAQSPKS